MKPETLRENLKGYITIELIDEIVQNQKLRELVEKEIESGQDGRIQSSLLFLQELLDRSKK